MLRGPIWDMGNVMALSQRDMGRPVGSDSALARFLAQVARMLRPNSLANDVSEVTGSLRRILHQLESLSHIDSHTGVRFGQEFGVRADTPAAVQVEVMQYVHDELVGLHAGLRRLPDQNAARRGPDVLRAGTASGFVYRD